MAKSDRFKNRIFIASNRPKVELVVAVEFSTDADHSVQLRINTNRNPDHQLCLQRPSREGQYPRP